MRDFYDIYILMKLRRKNINARLLSNAVKETAGKRGSVHVFIEGSTVLEEIFANGFSKEMWGRYQKQFTYAEGITWDDDIKESVFNMWSLVDFYMGTR